MFDVVLHSLDCVCCKKKILFNIFFNPRGVVVLQTLFWGYKHLWLIFSVYCEIPGTCEFLVSQDRTVSIRESRGLCFFHDSFLVHVLRATVVL